jgi:hypothetical protein
MGRPHLFFGIGDERGEEGRRPKFSMGSNQRRNRLGRWCIIEQNVAATIDLDVYEAGRQPIACGERFNSQIAWEISLGQQPCDPRAFDQDGCVLIRCRPVEHRIGGDGIPGGCVHRVRVIFCKCRG